MNYAVVKTGGKQYRVAPGDVIDVEKLPNDEGSTVELNEVLLVSQDGKLTIGSPLVPDAKVLGDVQQQARGEKLVIFKFKAKTRQRTKTGHRQSLTRLLVRDILIGETSLAPPEELPKPPTRPAAKAPAAEKPAAPPKRRRIRSAKSARELLEEKEDGS
ncbi:MAG: 50S ribosomal protein L21 [Chloroflexi bacterium]|nr:50S ribosomal protein L21 [Chloroflexota bacterium]